MIKAKRFWENVRVEAGEGYRIFLDERELKTPYKNALSLPTLALAEAVAEDWAAVEGEINPQAMPMTKMANSAIERIPNQRAEIENHLLEYLENDLLIYRVDEPEALSEKLKAWDSIVEWVKPYGITLLPTAGIVAKRQPAQNEVLARSWLREISDYQLVSFYEYVAITGSFVLGMAIFEDHLEAEEGFDLSRIDDDYQSEIWGEVEEKTQERAYKLAEIKIAKRFQDLQNLN